MSQSHVGRNLYIDYCDTHIVTLSLVIEVIKGMWQHREAPNLAR